MTYGELKKKLENDVLIQSIVNIARDPTIHNSRKDQLEGLIFLKITDKCWDEVNDNDTI